MYRYFCFTVNYLIAWMQNWFNSVTLPVKMLALLHKKNSPCEILTLFMCKVS